MLLGVFGPGMSRKTAQRLLAVLLVAAVLAFAFEAAGHWHNGPSGDQQCQICHFAHSIAVGLSHNASLEVPVAARRLSAATSVDLRLELVFHQLSSRAPPTQA